MCRNESACVERAYDVRPFARHVQATYQMLSCGSGAIGGHLHHAARVTSLVQNGRQRGTARACYVEVMSSAATATVTASVPTVQRNSAASGHAWRRQERPRAQPSSRRLANSGKEILQSARERWDAAGGGRARPPHLRTSAPPSARAPRCSHAVGRCPSVATWQQMASESCPDTPGAAVLPPSPPMEPPEPRISRRACHTMNRR